MEKLGRDILSLILRMCTVPSVLRLRECSKTMKGHADSGHLWKFFVARDFGVEVSVAEARLVYQDEYEMERLRGGRPWDLLTVELCEGPTRRMACYLRHVKEPNPYFLLWTARRGSIEMVKLLLSDPRMILTDEGSDAIGWAADYGRYEITELLLSDKRVDPSVDDNYAIRWAAANGHTRIVKLLLTDPRVDPNAALRKAEKNGHADVVELLRAHKRLKTAL